MVMFSNLFIFAVVGFLAVEGAALVWIERRLTRLEEKIWKDALRKK